MNYSLVALGVAQEGMMGLTLGVPTGCGPSVRSPQKPLVSLAAMALLATAAVGFGAGFVREHDKVTASFGKPLVAVNAVPLGRDEPVQWVAMPAPLTAPAAPARAARAIASAPSDAYQTSALAVSAAAPTVQADASAEADKSTPAAPDTVDAILEKAAGPPTLY